VSGSRGRCGVQVERWQQRPDQLLEPIEQPILDEIDHGNEIDYGYGIEP
jgi:hypothetical protein